MVQATQTASPWKSLVPAVRWLPEYQFGWLRPDIVAGITLAAYAIPAETRDLLRTEGLEAKVGRIDRFTSVADVVEGCVADKQGVSA